MGYELHIVRQNDYQDEEEESNISLEEWLAYVETDKELELTNCYKLNIPGIETTWQNVPGFCYWITYETSDPEAMPWFDFGSGCISAKYPDNDTIKKMITISLVLKAKVRGDDFEYYDETFFTNGGHPLVERQTDIIQQDKQVDIIEQDKQIDYNNKKPWWKFW